MTSLKDPFGDARPAHAESERKSLHSLIRPRRKPFWFQGRHCALITGASQGLGRAFAEECARLGMDLLLVALPASGLPEAADELVRRYGVRVEYLEADLTLPGSPEALRQWAKESGLRVSVLINNAGVGTNSNLFEASTLRDNESCILLNNLALVKITHLMLAELKSQPQAFILNVASLAAYFPLPLMPVYAPSKAFILNFSLALRGELRRTSVHVSVLCPNGIRTNASCRERIAAHGLAARLTCLNADQVAAYAIKEMLRERAVIVPGSLNKLLMAASKFVPLSAVYAVASTYWGSLAPKAEAASRQGAFHLPRRPAWPNLWSR